MQQLHFSRLTLSGVAIAALLAILWLAWSLLDPAPPRTIKIATGVKGGFYDRLGRLFQSALKAEGVNVEILTTAGSVENVNLLIAENDVDIAFVQGGISRRDNRQDDLRTLASLAIEPLWIFAKSGNRFDTIELRQDAKIAVGDVGSGTRDLVVRILDFMGRLKDVSLVALDGDTAVEALKAGDVDFAAYVTSPQTAWVQQLLRSPDISLAEPDHTSSLVRVLPFTTEIELPARILDFQRHVPPKDLRILGVATSLVVTPSAHPAIKQLLLSKAQELISGEPILGTRGKFPSTLLIDHPLDAEAVRFFQYGPTLVRRYLPYWVANLVERFWVLLLPIATILIPVLGFGPSTLDWNMRRRIYRWYRELGDLEAAVDAAPEAEKLEGLISNLDELRDLVKNVHVSLPYRRELYTLRAHITLVRQSATTRLREVSSPTEEPDR